MAVVVSDKRDTPVAVHEAATARTCDALGDAYELWLVKQAGALTLTDLRKTRLSIPSTRCRGATRCEGRWKTLLFTGEEF